MNDGVAVIVEVDQWRIERRLERCRTVAFVDGYSAI